MNPKKHILIIASSPRKNGNSTILAQKAVEGIKAGGGEAELVSISNLKIAPCNGCDACRVKSDAGCVIKDDMQPLYQMIKESQGVIFATPTYFFNMSAQIKAFIDRTYAMKSKDGWGFTGKDVGVILTYGDSDVFGAGGVNALRCFQDIFAYEKANYVGAVYGTASKPGDVKSDEELLESAFSLGERMAKPS